MKFVQFKDESEEEIVAVFANTQDETRKHQGTVEDEDERYLSFINPAPAEVITDPLEKLKAFLLANPDVAEILQ